MDAMLVTDPAGVEIRDSEDDLGLTLGLIPGRMDKEPGPRFVGRLGRGEFAPDRDEGDEGDGGLGLRSCHIVTERLV